MDSYGSHHRPVWELIPWVVNGTASDSERACVEEHLQGCADCREELEFQRRMQRSLAQEGAQQSSAHAGWSRLRERLDASEPSTSSPSRTRGLRVNERSWTPWVMAAMLVQGVGLGVLGTALWSRTPAASPPPSYRTLSAPLPAPPRATVRVVFAPSMTLAEMHAVLASAHLQVVSGPSEADVWSLGPAGEATDTATEEAVRTLRASASVRFAEPIGSSR